MTARTRQTLLSAEDVRVVYGERVILRSVSLQVSGGERLALLGRNGAGKTTLLRVLAGERRSDDGSVWRSEGLRLSVLDQQPLYQAGVTVQELTAAANPYQAAVTELRELEHDLSDPARLERWSAVQHRLEDLDAHAWPARAARTLAMLDLTRFMSREAATLSGGETTRLSLALCLLTEPDILLLDEPTNHLDIRMREWLENWLISFGGAVILTSHDREFLDKVALRSLWIEGGETTPYPGGYTRARQLRDQERQAKSKAARLSRREAGRLEGSAERLDVWGRRSRSVKSRAERLELTDAPQPERALRMRLLAGQSRAKLLLWAEHVGRSYGGKVILENVSLKLRQGDRVALMGANGTGKTTLLKLLSGELHPDPAPAGEAPGVLRLAAGVTLASLDQTWHGLSPDQPLHAQFEERFGNRAGALLGRAGFSSLDWPKTPHELSGGERARAGLALVSALRADLLLLDEPTNHLDVEALEALEAAVHAYGGAVVIVTHDRRFAREVSNRLWLIEDGHLTEVEGWGSRVTLDPARSLEGDPPPPPPPPSARERMGQTEARLRVIDQELNAATHAPLTQREEGRLRSERHRLRLALLDLYAEVYAAPQFDIEVREKHLRVRGQHLGSQHPEQGGMFWAACDESCGHFAWDGSTLRLMGLAPAWYAADLLGGTLRILFEHWQVGRVQLGEGGRVLSRRKYFELIGMVKS
ncbi:ABC transporter ATP-binding protein [Deinococcus psychrotolerans]|uniref:ABC transporter ATP-binding protein n=1 Tax=Deinococcus psychrotolerans TaxID=2489213 RepID=A0A3G8YBL0_9DEIO|nr:ABC-F family ATP-binding cassette domain-containing protein [Deinococcus psychrotolerans]AZI42769.1 ABC transporter ATP-binding protein [Deinococcus psychrotolerans]